jgi:hypothetical protein
VSVDRRCLFEDRLDDALLIPPKVGAGRYVEIDSTSVGMAGIWANVHAPEAAALDQRLDALAATVCPGRRWSAMC